MDTAWASTSVSQWDQSKVLQVMAARCWQPVRGMRRFSTAQIAFAIQSHSLSMYFDTHSFFSLHLSGCVMFRLQISSFLGLSFHSPPSYLNSIQSSALTTFRHILLGSSKTLDCISPSVVAQWNANTPTDIRMLPMSCQLQLVLPLSCFFPQMASFPW